MRSFFYFSNRRDTILGRSNELAANFVDKSTIATSICHLHSCIVSCLAFFEHYCADMHATYSESAYPSPLTQTEIYLSHVYLDQRRQLALAMQRKTHHTGQKCQETSINFRWTPKKTVKAILTLNINQTDAIYGKKAIRLGLRKKRLRQGQVSDR